MPQSLGVACSRQFPPRAYPGIEQDLSFVAYGMTLTTSSVVIYSNFAGEKKLQIRRPALERDT